MIAEILIFTAVVLITSLYFNYRERVQYFSSFKRRGIPGPEPDIFLGNFSEFKRIKNRNVTIERWVKTYGEVVGYYVGRKRYIMLTDLDMINNVFIKNVKLFYNREDFALDAKYLIDSVLALKDDRWAKVRRILTPTFSYSKVYQSKAFDSEIHSAVMELKKELVRKINEGNLIDLKGQKSVKIDAYKLMQSFTVDVISRTSFALEEKVYEPDNHLVAIVSEYFRFAGNVLVELGTLIPVLKSLLTFVNNNLSSGRLIDMMTVRLKEHINLFLKSHQNGSEPNPVSEQAKIEPDAAKQQSNLNRAKVLVSLIKKLAEKEITEHEFIGNILLILLAGYETTANAITYALYALARHPEIQEKLRAEVIKDGIESKYLEMVWYENLRYYPPVTFFVTRKAGEDCIINGVQFLKDDIVQAPVWLVHRDATYWPEPEVFRPERFDPEERKNHHPCQFLTYGIGQKACLGLNFANYEAKLLLINVLKEFKIETCEETPDPLDFIVPTVINNPSSPVVLKFSRIESSG